MPAVISLLPQSVSKHMLWLVPIQYPMCFLEGPLGILCHPFANNEGHVL